MLIRTPLRVGSATVWADPGSGTVRLGARDRTRTLLAGLDPASYLIAQENSTIVATAGSTRALSFSVERGASAAVATLPKPDWCAAVEQTLPEPLEDVPSWLEVGVRGYPLNWFCSIPLGRLPLLQARLSRRGGQLTYITRIEVAAHDRG